MQTYLRKHGIFTAASLPLPALCIICGVWVLFVMDNYGGFWHDEYYQTICVRRYSESPLGLLTFFIGRCWTDIFGFSVLNLRHLTSVETVLAVGVTSCFLYRHTRNLRLSAVSFLLGCILMKLTAFGLYNWDSGTYLFDALTGCLLIAVISNPTSGRCLLLGFFAGLMTMGRIPSGIILPLSLLLVFIACRFYRRSEHSVRSMLLICGGWVLAVVAVGFIVAGSPLHYPAIFRQENFISGHSIAAAPRFFKRLVDILHLCGSYWFVGTGSLFLAVILPRIRKMLALWLLILWIGICLLWTYGVSKAVSGFPLILGGDSIVGFGLLAAYPAFCIFTGRKTRPVTNLKLWAVFAVMLSMAFGSDGYMQRMTAGFLLPLIIATIWEAAQGRLRGFVRSALGICTLVFGSMFAFHAAYLRVRTAPRLSEIKVAPLQGILTYWEQEREILNLREAVVYLQANGIPYAVAGDHLAAEAVYGADNGIPFHTFHEDLWESWDKYKAVILPRVDAVVFPDDIPGYDFETMMADLPEEGFTDVVSIGAATVYFRSPSP